MFDFSSLDFPLSVKTVNGCSATLLSIMPSGRIIGYFQSSATGSCYAQSWDKYGVDRFSTNKNLLEPKSMEDVAREAWDKIGRDLQIILLTAHNSHPYVTCNYVCNTFELSYSAAKYALTHFSAKDL